MSVAGTPVVEAPRSIQTTRMAMPRSVVSARASGIILPPPASGRPSVQRPPIAITPRLPSAQRVSSVLPLQIVPQAVPQAVDVRPTSSVKRVPSSRKPIVSPNGPLPATPVSRILSPQDYALSPAPLRPRPPAATTPPILSSDVIDLDSAIISPRRGRPVGVEPPVQLTAEEEKELDAMAPVKSPLRSPGAVIRTPVMRPSSARLPSVAASIPSASNDTAVSSPPVVTAVPVASIPPAALVTPPPRNDGLDEMIMAIAIQQPTFDAAINKLSESERRGMIKGILLRHEPNHKWIDLTILDGPYSELENYYRFCRQKITTTELTSQWKKYILYAAIAIEWGASFLGFDLKGLAESQTLAMVSCENALFELACKKRGDFLGSIPPEFRIGLTVLFNAIIYFVIKKIGFAPSMIKTLAQTLGWNGTIGGAFEMIAQQHSGLGAAASSSPETPAEPQQMKGPAPRRGRPTAAATANATANTS